MLTRIKNWLHGNKIYFDTVVPLALGVAAIIIGIATYKIANKQATMTLGQSLPLIHVDAQWTWSGNPSEPYEETLVVSNSNQNDAVFFKDLKVYPATLLEIASSTDYGVFPWWGIVAISDFYGSPSYSQEMKGQIASCTKSGNIQAEWEIERQFSDYSWAQHEQPYPEIERYVEVQYQDASGEEHSQYFHVDPLQGTTELTGETAISAAQQMIDLYRNADVAGISISISGTTLDVLLQKVAVSRQVLKDYPSAELLMENRLVVSITIP